MATLISYDLKEAKDGDHERVLSELKKKCYQTKEFVNLNDKKQQLPETTIISIKDVTEEQVKSDFRILGVTIDKIVLGSIEIKMNYKEFRECY